MGNLFNTVFETELRLLIMLEAEDAVGSCEVTDGQRTYRVLKSALIGDVYYKKIPILRQSPPDSKMISRGGKMMKPDPAKRQYRVIECQVVCKATAEKLAALDFVAIYGASFGITESNLHGDGDYKFSEFAVRRELTQKALRELVQRGFVKVANSSYGFVYTITEAGKAFCEELTDEYAAEYRENLVFVADEIGEMSERDITAFINQHSVNSLKRR
jgi:hypothetical protein